MRNMHCKKVVDGEEMYVVWKLLEGIDKEDTTHMGEYPEAKFFHNAAY